MIACAENLPDMVSYIISLGADLDMVDEGKQSALFWAASSGAMECVDLLLAAGANTVGALHGAAQQGKVEVVKRLLQAGANADGVDLRGRKPLQLAVQFSADHSKERQARQREIITMLLAAGANPAGVLEICPSAEAKETLISVLRKEY